MNRTRTLIASFCLAAFVTGPAQSQVVSTTPPPPQSAPSGQAPAKAPPSKVASHPARPIDIRVENGAVSATLATPADVVEVGKAIPFTLTITATDGADVHRASDALQPGVLRVAGSQGRGGRVEEHLSGG